MQRLQVARVPEMDANSIGQARQRLCTLQVPTYELFGREAEAAQRHHPVRGLGLGAEREGQARHPRRLVRPVTCRRRRCRLQRARHQIAGAENPA